jgi:hypothetical protein
MRLIAALIPAFLALPALGQDAKPRSGFVVWDTGTSSASPLSLADKSAWKELPADADGATFKGDAVMTNGKVTVVVRKQAPIAELYAAPPAPRARFALLSAAGDVLSRIERVALVEQAKGSIALDVSGRTEKGAEVAAKLRLKRGDIAIETEPGTGAGALRVECPARFGVLPDFFADDLVIDPTKFPGATLDLPSENILLHLIGNGEAIAACVFENREQEARVSLSGDGDKRQVVASEIRFGQGRKVWVAILEAPGIWHTVDVRAQDAGKIAPLEWKMPFVAAWRADFTRTNDLTDSWEMLLQEKENDVYLKPSWMGRGSERIKQNRKRWTTILEDFSYPVWSDPERRGFIQPLKKEALKFKGPLVLYPINRVPQTPLDAFTIVDVLRNTLGVGPCQYILDLDGQKSEYKGQGGCDTRDQLNAIYTKGEQKAKRAEIEKALKDVHVCISYVNGRILHYLDFAKKTHAWIEEQKKARPEAADFLAEMDKIVSEIDVRWTARSEKIRTPDFVLKISEEFRKDVLDSEGPDALDLCKKFTKQIVEVADNQDEMLGECRWALRALRQRAGLAPAKDPKLAPVAAELRARAQEAMRNPASLEGARH